MKYFLIATLFAFSPNIGHAAPIDPYLNVLKKLGLIADSTTKVEASTCSRYVAMCFDTMEKAGLWKMGSESAQMAEELSQQAVRRLDSSIRLQEGLGNALQHPALLNSSLDEILEDIGIRLTPSTEESLVILAKLWHMNPLELRALSMKTLLNTVEVLQLDQVAGRPTLTPAAFQGVSDSLLALAIGKQAVEKNSMSLARLRVIVAENKLFSEAMSATNIAAFSDQNIAEISDLFAQIDMAKVRPALREQAYTKIENVFQLLVPKVGESISLNSYSRLLLSLHSSVFDVVGSAGIRNSFLYYLTADLARVALKFPEILDDPAINQLLKSRSGFPHPDVDFFKPDRPLRSRFRDSGPAAIVVS